MGYKTNTSIGRLYEELRENRNIRHKLRYLLLAVAVINMVIAFSLGYPEDNNLLYILPLSAYFIFGFVGLDAILEINEKKRVRKILAAQYLRDFFLTMQIREPEGETEPAKFLNLAGEALPPLKIWMDNHDDEKIPTTTLTDGYKLDIYIKTEEGVFLLKYIESVVTMDDVEDFYEKITQHDEIKKKHLLRAILLGKNFDNLFYEKGLDGKMEDLYKTYKIPKTDLFIVEDTGFNAMWISGFT